MQPFEMKEIISLNQFIEFKCLITVKEKGYMEYKKSIYVRTVFESKN